MPVKIIAEAGVNHGGDADAALRMVDAACAAGADIVKFQTYSPLHAIHPTHRDYSLLSSLALSHNAFLRITKTCEALGIEFMSTPGDLVSLKFLVEEAGVKRIKIGSDDLTYSPLIEAAAATGLPLIISTGMATEAEIFKMFEDLGTTQTSVTLLQCTSSYPCAPEDVNLLIMQRLQHLFGYPVGYSDHTKGTLACIAAAACGAEVIEKHFMLTTDFERAIDISVSINEYQLKTMVKNIRLVEQFLGADNVCKEPCAAELELIPLVRKGKDGMKCA